MGVFDELFDGLVGERAEKMGELISKLRDVNVSEEQRIALGHISERLGCSRVQALGRSIGWASAIVNHVRNGGRVVFVNADGTEAKLKVKVVA